MAVVPGEGTSAGRTVLRPLPGLGLSQRRGAARRRRHVQHGEYPRGVGLVLVALREAVRPGLGWGRGPGPAWVRWGPGRGESRSGSGAGVGCEASPPGVRGEEEGSPFPDRGGPWGTGAWLLREEEEEGGNDGRDRDRSCAFINRGGCPLCVDGEENGKFGFTFQGKIS